MRAPPDNNKKSLCRVRSAARANGADQSGATALLPLNAAAGDARLAATSTPNASGQADPAHGSEQSNKRHAYTEVGNVAQKAGSAGWSGRPVREDTGCTGRGRPA